ncbi:MAG: hypothetical protein CSA72_02705 [Rhodobacterales bacterium]|nr:MAG: hypothetical protein CSA72_02705 [Rhodobacterales bacterium]
MIEFLYQTALADCYLYAGSRSEPDFPKGVGAGSSFHFALKHACNTGHVKDRFYTMQDCITEKPVAPLKRRARDYRISGCVDLLDSTTNMTHLMRLIKATLSGNLTREMAPNLVGVSLVLYESFHSAASGQDGLISIPLDGERRSDNHAMVIVGYIDADHPSNPYGITLYLVRNSWGSEWASDNPYGFEGHALIPEAYFTRERVIEAYFAMI